MATGWWQRLRRRGTPSYFAFDDRGAPGGRSWKSAGWWVRAESKPVRAGIAAAAKPVPTLMSAWTFHTPSPSEPIEEPLPRGDERVALLWEWGLELADKAAVVG